MNFLSQTHRGTKKTTTKPFPNVLHKLDVCAMGLPCFLQTVSQQEIMFLQQILVKNTYVRGSDFYEDERKNLNVA